MTPRHQWHALSAVDETLDAGEAFCGQWIEGNGASEDSWRIHRPPEDACVKCLAVIEAER
jgi:hypothetical protein